MASRDPVSPMPRPRPRLGAGPLDVPRRRGAIARAAMHGHKTERERDLPTENVPSSISRPGTLVFDQSVARAVRYRHEWFPGPRRLKFDFVHSGPLRGAHWMCVPILTSGLQPFREAIDFVKDLKAPIEIDKSAFRRAGIDPSFEVHCCDIEDLTATELLRWIAAQSPKPIALVERDGKARAQTCNRRPGEFLQAAIGVLVSRRCHESPLHFHAWLIRAACLLAAACATYAAAAAEDASPPAASAANQPAGLDRRERSRRSASNCPMERRSKPGRREWISNHEWQRLVAA